MAAFFFFFLPATEHEQELIVNCEELALGSVCCWSATLNLSLNVALKVNLQMLSHRLPRTLAPACLLVNICGLTGTEMWEQLFCLQCHRADGRTTYCNRCLKRLETIITAACLDLKSA